MSEARFWVAIPAAGIGRRMGAELPKQYLPLAGRKVIDHAVERLLEHPRLDGVVVAIAAADRWWAESEFAGHPDVTVVTGGAERSHSVLNALDRLAHRADLNDWVLVHDAARPCVRRSDITRLVERVREHSVGGLLGIPVRDTMKRTDDAGRVVGTVPREDLWHAFTPQMFRLGMLREAMRTVVDQGATATDEAGIMEQAGYRPLMVEGHPDNLKVTRPEDLALAEFYLRRQVAAHP